MSAERHQRVTQYFLRCCELAPAERAPYLNDVCADDPSIADEVREMLTADAEDRRLPTHTGPIFDFGALADVSEEPIPEHIADFEIIDRIGIGGMGVVYSAWQREPHRRVALKVIRSGLVDARALRHFRREVELLARLQHAGIAQIYAAGRTEGSTPQPYFAMELVEGRSLMQHVERLGLPTRQRILLFLQICRAVHHAHVKGVVHRDLKPSNVLVTEEGMVKVLDFGIALATEVDAITLAEEAGTGLLGTVSYMSPEQARGEVLDLDARSDVYSLGVLLFETVSNSLPHAVEGQTFYQALRTKCEEPPRRLRAVAEGLPLDLEAIAAKALETDREHRYQSVSEFAADLERFLEGRPVEARRLTPWYLARKYAERYRVAVAASSLAVLALVAITLVSLHLRGIADQRLRTVNELRDQRVLAQLVRRSNDELWPRRPERLPWFDRWLADADAVRERWPAHRQNLTRVRDELDALGPGAEDRRATLLWYRDALENLARGLEDFFGPGGLVEQVREDERIARTVVERTVVAEAEAWARVRSEILADSRFLGLELEPQIGLVPLGRNRSTGIQEFWVWESGDRPQRGVDGEPSLGADCGVILCLVPGGRSALGRPFHLSGSDDSADPDDWTSVRVDLEPYFLSKYELSVSQAGRVGFGMVPGSPGDESDFGGSTPRTMLSWAESIEIAVRYQAMLPTEAQWEAAALYPPGSHPDGEEHPGTSLGLVDMGTSLGEWTACPYGFLGEDLLRVGDGARILADGGPDRVVRGRPAPGRRWASILVRDVFPPNTRSIDLGVRLARAITRPASP